MFINRDQIHWYRDIDRWWYQHKLTSWYSSTRPNFNTLRPRHNGRHFADDIFKCIFLNENVWIPIKISVKFVSKGPVNDIPALVQIMAWRRPGNKPLSEPRLVSLPTHICVTRPQWVNGVYINYGMQSLIYARKIIIFAKILLDLGYD